MTNKKRKVSLTDFKKYDDGKNEVILDNIGKDIIIDNDLLNITSKLPLIYNDGQFVLRYKNFKHICKFLKEFIPTTLYFRLCKRGDKLVFVRFDKSFFDDDVFDIVDKLPSNTSGYSVGDEVIVNTEANEFNNIFRISGDTTRYEILFNELCAKVYNDSGITYSTPFIDFPLYIEDVYNDIGLMQPYFSVWVPNKKYYVGDVVFYEDKFYMLSGNTASDSFSGYYNTNEKITYFERPRWSKRPKGEGWWVEVEHDEESIVIDASTITDDFKMLERKKKTVDDNGDLLPFIVEKIPSGNTYEYYSSFPFKLGYMNHRIDDDMLKCDFIHEIKFYDGNNTIKYDVDLGTFDTIYLLYGDVADSFINGNDKYVVITNDITHFDVYVDYGVVLDNVANKIIPDTGIKHVLSYSCEIINDFEYTYDNINLKTFYISVFKFLNNQTIINVIDSAKPEQGSMHIFKDDNLIGVHDCTISYTDGNEINIDRGVSSALERHNALSEINSIDDLDEYRNGYFN